MHYAVLLVLFTLASLLKCRHPLFFLLISGRKQPWGWNYLGVGGGGANIPEQGAQEANKPQKATPSISVCFHRTTTLTAPHLRPCDSFLLSN